MQGTVPGANIKGTLNVKLTCTLRSYINDTQMTLKCIKKIIGSYLKWTY